MDKKTKSQIKKLGYDTRSHKKVEYYAKYVENGIKKEESFFLVIPKDANEKAQHTLAYEIFSKEHPTASINYLSYA